MQTFAQAQDQCAEATRFAFPNMAQTTVKVAMNVVTDMLQQLAANAESLTAAELSRAKAEESVVKSIKTSQVGTVLYANGSYVILSQCERQLTAVRAVSRHKLNSHSSQGHPVHCRAFFCYYNRHDSSLCLHNCSDSCSLGHTPLPLPPNPRHNRTRRGLERI